MFRKVMGASFRVVWGQGPNFEQIRLFASDMAGVSYNVISDLAVIRPEW
jgi:hypothetical protein